jgi:hypothetical protein
VADAPKPTAWQKRLKFRAVYRALKALEDDWNSQKSKKMHRARAIEKVQAIRVSDRPGVPEEAADRKRVAVFGPPGRPLTPHEEEIRPFAMSVTHDVDMVAVLRGHLYLERAMFALLLQSEPGRDGYFKRMSFSTMVDALATKRLIPSEAIASIRAINDIRNEFGHELERTELDADGEKNVEAAMTGPMASVYGNVSRG